MGKNKLKKFAQMQMFSNVIDYNIDYKSLKDTDIKGRWRENFFKNNNPIVLELACGKGEYSVNLAQKYPEKNFIAIDIKGARMWTGAKQALELNLQNVAFLRTRIEFLNYFFLEDEVDEIWIPFPDPQPKKPQKRLISPFFLNLYRKFLKDNAIIHLKTDNENLYEYALKVLRKNNVEPLLSFSDIYSNKEKLPSEVVDIQTYYEQMFIRDYGKKITYLKFRFSKTIFWQDVPKNPPGSPYK